MAAVSWISASASAPARQPQPQGTIGRASDPGDVRTLLDTGKLVEAEAAATADLAAAEKTYGADAPATADALELLLEARRGLRRNLPGSVALAERLVKLRETIAGPNDDSTATALVTLGRIKSTNRDYDARAPLSSVPSRSAKACTARSISPWPTR